LARHSSLLQDDVTYNNPAALRALASLAKLRPTLYCYESSSVIQSQVPQWSTSRVLPVWWETVNERCESTKVVLWRVSLSSVANLEFSELFVQSN